MVEEDEIRVEGRLEAGANEHVDLETGRVFLHSNDVIATKS